MSPRPLQRPSITRRGQPKHVGLSGLHHLVSPVNAKSVSRDRIQNVEEYLTFSDELQERFDLPAEPTALTQGEHTLAQYQQNQARELHALLQLLPPEVKRAVLEHASTEQLEEVVLDLGRPPLARFAGGDVELSQQAVTDEDLVYATSHVGAFGGDNRAGINSTLHRISCIRNRSGKIVGLTCRVGRSVPGSAAMVADLVIQGCSILLLGRPGMGKTTTIRDIARLLADTVGKRVVICDTSNEIGGDGDVPHPGIGRARRMQVSHPDAQARVMIEAVENHMPQVIVIDEIGTEAETRAARTISQRGVQLIATAHGNRIENVLKNPSLVDLVGGVSTVTLGDEEARRRGGQKTILERTSPPCFDVCIEMVTKDEWAVHSDVARAVDLLLAGSTPPMEVRIREDDGRIKVISNSARQGAPASSGNTQRAQGNAESSTTGGFSPRQFSTDSRAVALWSEDSFDDEAIGFQQFEEPHQRPEPSGDRIRLYLCGVDEGVVQQVMASLGMPGAIRVVDKLQDADLVLGTRQKMRQGSEAWLRAACKEAGIPVIAARGDSVSDCVKALRVIVGIDPSPGNLFGNPEEPNFADPVRGARSGVR